MKEHVRPSMPLADLNRDLMSESSNGFMSASSDNMLDGEFTGLEQIMHLLI
jgi:hypothetical protein